MYIKKIKSALMKVLVCVLKIAISLCCLRPKTYQGMSFLEWYWQKKRILFFLAMTFCVI